MHKQRVYVVYLVAQHLICTSRMTAASYNGTECGELLQLVILLNVCTVRLAHTVCRWLPFLHNLNLLQRHGGRHFCNYVENAREGDCGVNQ